MKIFALLKRNRTLIARCGHKTKEKDTVTAFDEGITTKVPIKNGTTEYCHRCLEKMAIKCAWCGHVIFVGEPITLYSPRKKDFKVPEHAVVYCKNPLQLVGCLRFDCAESGADRVGFWYPPGEVMRVKSPLQIAMETNDVVVVNNVCDPKEAIESSRD